MEISTEQLERWLAGRPSDLCNATRAKYVTALGAIFKRARRVWGLQTNPSAGLERPRVRNQKTIEVYAPEEVWVLARAADDQDAAREVDVSPCLRQDLTHPPVVRAIGAFAERFHIAPQRMHPRDGRNNRRTTKAATVGGPVGNMRRSTTARTHRSRPPGCSG